MTRGKWVALAVLLAVIALIIPNGPAVWRVVAYVEERHDGVLTIRKLEVGQLLWSTATSQPIARFLMSPPNPNYIVITRKRFNWLPGRDRMVRCAWCVESTHVKCPGDKYALLLPKEAPPAETYTTCTCPHPSHAQESE